MPINLVNQNSYPLNGTTTFPIGEELVVEFDNLVDDKSAKESIILLEGNNVIETDIKSFAVSNDLKKIEDNFLERLVNQKTLVTIKPKAFLNANTNYELFIKGSLIEEQVNLSEEFLSQAISERTIFNTSLNNTFTDQIRVYGSYQGKSEQELYIKIINSGEGSSAKYVWWFSDEDEPQINSKRANRTASRWRSLRRGCYIKFYGGTFTLGETYKVKVYPENKLENSYRIKFSTSSDDLILKPTEISESDIGLNIPESNVATFKEELRIVGMTPKNGSINNSTETNKIIIHFNKNIDASSVTQQTVNLFKQPVSGFFNTENKEEKIPKEIIVEDNKIILEF